MAKPSEKNPAIDETITKVFGIDRKGSIESDQCTWCKKPATEFRDDLSRKEYSISGLCQKCQDEIWKE